VTWPDHFPHRIWAACDFEGRTRDYAWFGPAEVSLRPATTFGVSYQRGLDRIEDDCLYPVRCLCPDPEQDGQRVRAVVEVLRRLPPEVYDKVAEELVGSFTWFIPSHQVWGMAYLPGWTIPLREGDGLVETRLPAQRGGPGALAARSQGTGGGIAVESRVG
jgi:hypothetical protein